MGTHPIFESDFDCLTDRVTAMEARERTDRRCRELFAKFVTEGLEPNQAAARAIRVIKGETEAGAEQQQGAEDMVEEAEEPMEVAVEALTTDVTEFMDFIVNQNREQVSEFINNVFGSMNNLSGSFQIDQVIDWDGIRRCYDAIDEHGYELSLVVALTHLTDHIASNSDETGVKVVASLVMSLLNPSIASPCYLSTTLPALCRLIVHVSAEGNQRLEFIKILAMLPSVDMLQLVRNMQQAITIRVVEFGDDDEVHTDEHVILYVKTLQLIFYANLLSSKQSNESDWRHAHVATSSSISSSQQSTQNEANDDDDNLDSIRPITEDERQIERILRADRSSTTANSTRRHHQRNRRGSANSQQQQPIEQELDVDWSREEKPIVPYVEFQNDIVNGALNVHEDFLARFDFVGGDLGRESNNFFSFEFYPFMLTTENKTQFLFYDSKVKQYAERHATLFHGALQIDGFQHSSPYLKLNVSRHNIVQDTLMRLEMVAADNPAELQKQLFVEFDGEQGVDESGLSKEFFSLVIAQILKPEYGMFCVRNDYHFFNQCQFQDTEKEFMLIGMLLGLSIYNSINLDVAFPTVVFKKLTGLPEGFHDLAHFEPDLYQNMSKLLEYDEATLASIGMTMVATTTSMFGEVNEHELVANGASVNVTKENVHQYVDQYADFLLNKSIQKSFHAFHRGFELVTHDSPLATLFRPEELEVMVIGQRSYDWGELRESCKYDGEFNEQHHTVKHFWSVFDELDESEKRALLEFFTGSDRVPIGGLGRLKPRIQSSGPDSDRLPTAHTCFYILLLPAYVERENLKERLLKAIQNAKGFGMI